MDSDPWELNNIINGAGAALAAKELPLAVTLGGCSGAPCWAPAAAPHPGKKPLACKNVTKGAGYQ